MKSKAIGVFCLATGVLAVGLAQAADAEIKQGSWADKVTVKGDVRLRFEHIDKEGSPTRSRERIRARLGVDGKVGDELKAGFGIRTGGTDPVSGNQTLGDGFGSKDLALELAYVEWSPASAPGLRLTGGKMKNPFLQVSDLVWDGDLNPEGAALQYKLGLGSATLTANSAALVVTERGKESDAFIYAGQAGLDVKTEAGIGIMAGVGYYLYDNMKGYGVLDWEESFNSFGNSANETVDAEGNVTAADYANDYGVLEFMAAVGVKCPLTGLPLRLYGNLVRNLEADANDTGYLAGLTLGKAREPGSFELGYNYRRLDADAVVGAFTDSDSWGGGSNGKGHKMKFALQVAKNWQLGATYFITEAGIRDEDSGKDYRRLQLDLAANF